MKRYKQRKKEIYAYARGVLWSFSHKKLKVITKWNISPPLAMEHYGLQRMRALYLLIRQYRDERMYNMTMGQACLKQVVNEN
jgi:hypothetical protein